MNSTGWRPLRRPSPVTGAAAAASPRKAGRRSGGTHWCPVWILRAGRMAWIQADFQGFGRIGTRIGARRPGPLPVMPTPQTVMPTPQTVMSAPHIVIPGLVPGIHAAARRKQRRGMPGTSPGMTEGAFGHGGGGPFGHGGGGPFGHGGGKRTGDAARAKTPGGVSSGLARRLNRTAPGGTRHVVRCRRILRAPAGARRPQPPGLGLKCASSLPSTPSQDSASGGASLR